MKFALLIYTTLDASGEDEEKIYGEYAAFAEDVARAGKMRGGEELAEPETGTLVRVRDGERLVVDGPYSETKEHLGGFFLVDAADLDEAIGYAAKIPGARYGTIEVRPVVERS